MKNVVLLILIYFVIDNVYGQNVKISSSAAIESTMNRFAAEGRSEESVKGWRIQIVTTDDRREMETAQTTFKSMYPGICIDWKHVAPYYQVRVGYFENKNKLMPLLLELKNTFPSATYIYDQVPKRVVVY